MPKFLRFVSKSFEVEPPAIIKITDWVLTKRTKKELFRLMHEYIEKNKDKIPKIKEQLKTIEPVGAPDVFENLKKDGFTPIFEPKKKITKRDMLKASLRNVLDISSLMGPLALAQYPIVGGKAFVYGGVASLVYALLSNISPHATRSEGKPFIGGEGLYISGLPPIDLGALLMNTKEVQRAFRLHGSDQYRAGVLSSLYTFFSMKYFQGTHRDTILKSATGYLTDAEQGVHKFERIEGPFIASYATALISLFKAKEQGDSFPKNFMHDFLKYVKENSKSKILRKRAEKLLKKGGGVGVFPG